MMIVKRIMAFIGICTASLIMGCGTDPLLTNIGTNQLLVVLKGTYESNSPMPWSMPDPCQAYAERVPGDPASVACSAYTAAHTTTVQDDSVIECDGSNPGPYGKDDTNPGAFLMDISEIKLVDYNGDTHKFANYRQTYAFGMNEVDPFFSGVGYLLDNDDAPSKAYAAILLYVRKMLVDGAKRYTPDAKGWRSELVWDVFSETELPTFNFNKFQMHSYYDTLRYESAYLNRVYPIIIPISDLKGMIFSNEFPYTVLEIRIVVKNFIKKYEQIGVNGNLTTATHYYALSDWLQDVQPGDSVIGGNILTVARSYVPGLVGSISGTIPLGSGSPGRHVIAIPEGASINEYTIPLNPRSLNNCNLPTAPGLSLSTNIVDMMAYYLKLEKFNNDWNLWVPGICTTFDTFTTEASKAHTYILEWDKFAGEIGMYNFKIPHYAVFAGIDPAATPPLTGAFTIDNVSPGSYNLYIANVAPTYGMLYNDGQFTPYSGNPVAVSIGSNTVVTFP